MFTRKALDQQANEIANLRGQVDYLGAKLGRKTAKIHNKVNYVPG